MENQERRELTCVVRAPERAKRVKQETLPDIIPKNFPESVRNNPQI